MEKKWYNKTITEIENELNTNAEMGLTQEQINKNIAKYGLNELKTEKKKS